MNAPKELFSSIRTIAGALSLAVLVAACDGGDLQTTPEFYLDGSETDGTVESDSGPSLEVTNPRFIGASSSGDRVIVEVDVVASLEEAWQDYAGIDLVLEVTALNEDTGEWEQLGASSYSPDKDDFNRAWHVPFYSTSKFARLEAHLDSRRHDDRLTTVYTDLSPLLDTVTDTVNAATIGTLKVEQVGEYHIKDIDGFRQHDFSLRIFSQGIDGPDYLKGFETYNRNQEPRDATGYIRIKEEGDYDVESLATTRFSSNRLVFHLLLDNSYSIDAFGHTETLINDAVKTLLQVRESAQIAEFRYYQFAMQPRRINSLLDYDVEDIPSGTALYYSMDKVLADIREGSAPADQNVLVVFTDGYDLASLNHYDYVSNAEVASHVMEQIRVSREQLKSRDQGNGGATLEVHLVTLDNPSDFSNYNNDKDLFQEHRIDTMAELSSALDNITRKILGTYHVEYVSQRASGQSQIEVEVASYLHEEGKPVVSWQTDGGVVHEKASTASIVLTNGAYP